MNPSVCLLPRLLVLAWIALWLVSCGGSTMWYQPGKNQRDFDWDTLECERSAAMLARQDSLTARPNFSAYADYYTRCLQSRGWSRTKPEAVAGAAELPDAIYESGHLAAFGLRLKIPDGFELIQTDQASDAQTGRRIFLWSRQGGEYLHLVVQQAMGTEFQAVAYPYAAATDILYDQDASVPGRPLWRSFYKSIAGQPVGIAGSIWRLDKHRRLVWTATHELPAGIPEAESTLRITPAQHRTMADFTDRWAAWYGQSRPPQSVRQWLDRSSRWLAGQE